MKGPLDVHRELLSVGVRHEIVRLPRNLSAAQDLPAVLGVTAADCLAVGFYAVDGGWLATLAEVGAVPDEHALARVLRVRSVRPASPARVNDVTDFTAGLVAPLPLPPEVLVLADSAIRRDGIVYTATGDVRTALAISAEALLRVTAARTAPLTARPRAYAGSAGS